MQIKNIFLHSIIRSLLVMSLFFTVSTVSAADEKKKATEATSEATTEAEVGNTSMKSTEAKDKKKSKKEGEEEPECE